MSQNEPLTAKQLIAAHAIAQGQSRLEACAAARCSLATLKRWSKDPLFLSEIRECQKGIFDEAIAISVQKSVEAIAHLASIAESSQNESARVAAAKAILELGFKGIVHADIQQRLAVIEADIENGR
jgi:hypothetical protein